MNPNTEISTTLYIIQKDLEFAIHKDISLEEARQCLMIIPNIQESLNSIENKAKDILDAETERIARKKSNTNTIYEKTG